MAGVARLAEGTPLARRARELLERALDDGDFRVRIEAAAGLVTLGDAKAIPALERAARAELDGRAKRRLREAMPGHRPRRAGRPSRRASCREEVERLRNELGELRGRLERVESVGGSGGRASARRRNRSDDRAHRHAGAASLERRTR